MLHKYIPASVWKLGRRISIKLASTVAVLMTGLLVALLFIPLNEGGSDSLLLFFGRFHPLILHLPIGILFWLFLMELAQWVRPKLQLDQSCEIL